MCNTPSSAFAFTCSQRGRSVHLADVYRSPCVAHGRTVTVEIWHRAVFGDERAAREIARRRATCAKQRERNVLANDPSRIT
eukprot:2789434-Alexandrium_andersonii.AAC.1